MTDIIRRLHCTIRCDIETAASGCHCAEARDEITRLRALNAELVAALKAELADHEEAIAHDRGGLQYASLVGIPLSNADSLAQSVQYHERRAGFIRAALAKAERETRTAAMDALIKTDGELL